MTVKCQDIINYIESIAPPQLAENWDNSGMMLGDRNSIVNKVIVCLDVTPGVADEAISASADLILSHHPLIFKGIKSIIQGNLTSGTIIKLLKNDVAVYSAHTNLDAAREGVNDNLAKVLELTDIKYLNEGGIGRVGNLTAPAVLKDFIQAVKKQLNIDSIRVIGNMDKKIRRVSVFSGSFDGNWTDIIREGSDVLVTGDIKHHTALEALELGLTIIDAGHYATESAMLPRLIEMLSNRFPGMSIIRNTVERNPFITC